MGVPVKPATRKDCMIGKNETHGVHRRVNRISVVGILPVMGSVSFFVCEAH
jgi:hypothetical protein